MYRSNAETIYELSTFPRFYPLLTTAQTFEITALSSRRALKMFLLEINRDYFCGKPVVLELAKKEGFIKGLLDFRDDDYRNVVIDIFEEFVLHLKFGRKLNINEITKIEELTN